MTLQVDVLVIGGGPAGLSAGIVFARHGLKTIVCEQKRIPADKACGEGLLPVGVAQLRRLGVAPYLHQENYFPFAGIRYISAGNRAATGIFREGPGWGIPRPNLSMAFFQRAQECDLLEIRQGIRARPIARQRNRGIWVQVGAEQIRARLLVGADGLHSQVRRWAGLNARPKPPHRWGARQHFEISPWSPFVEVYWGSGVEAYITPCRADLVNVAFLWDRNCLRGLKGGKSLIQVLLADFPQLQERLEKGIPVDAPKSSGPLRQEVTSPAAEGLVLIGDAAGYLDALTGEGVSLALAQALALEATVVPLLMQTVGDRAPISASQLAPYCKTYRAIYRPYQIMTHLALLLARHPLLAEGAVRMLARQPALFQALLSANMGLLSPWMGPSVKIVRENPYSTSGLSPIDK